MVDYKMKDRIISAKIDPFEWIQKRNDYLYTKAKWSLDSVANANLLVVKTDQGGAFYWWHFLVLHEEQHLFYVGATSFILDEYWNSTDSGGGYAASYFRGRFPILFFDCAEDPMYATMGKEAAVRSFIAFHSDYMNYVVHGFYNLTNSQSPYSRADIIDYLRDTLYDLKDPEFKPLPDYYGENEILNVDQYGEKIIESESDESFSEVSWPFLNYWWTGYDGNLGFWIPVGLVPAESSRFEKQILVLVPQYIFDLQYGRGIHNATKTVFLIPRYQVCAFGREKEFKDIQVTEVDEARCLKQFVDDHYGAKQEYGKVKQTSRGQLSYAGWDVETITSAEEAQRISNIVIQHKNKVKATLYAARELASILLFVNKAIGAIKLPFFGYETGNSSSMFS